ncbi:MAG: hypothetical protein ABEJ65_00940, partial [bacterium]
MNFLTKLFKADQLKSPFDIGLFYGGYFLFLIPLTYFQLYSNDLWKSLYSGRYIAQFLKFPSHSEFTFSPAVDFFPPYAFQWLSNLFFYGLYNLGGVTGLQLFRVFIVLGTVILLHSLSNYRTSLFTFIILLLFVLASLQKIMVRDALFSLPLMTVFFWLWYRVRFKHQFTLMAGIPLLFLFWGNMHLSFLAGIGIFGSILLGECIDSFFKIQNKLDKRRWLQIVGVFLLCVAVVTWIKPYADPVISGSVTSVVSVFDTHQKSKDLSSSQKKPGNLLNWFKTKFQSLLLDRQFSGTANSVKGAMNTLRFTYTFFVRASLLLLGIGVLTFFFWRKPFRFSLFIPFLVSCVVGLMFMRFVVFIPLVL